jgi:hypothetical protein
MTVYLRFTTGDIILRKKFFNCNQWRNPFRILRGRGHTVSYSRILNIVSFDRVNTRILVLVFGWIARLSPIPVGRRGVISPFNWFQPAFPRVEEGGGGRHPGEITENWTHRTCSSRMLSSAPVSTQAKFHYMHLIVYIFLHLFSNFLVAEAVEIEVWSCKGDLQ